VSSSTCSGDAKRRRAQENQGFRAASIALIKEMAANNRLWGAERIRGELLTLEIHVSKRTIQKVMHVNVTQAPTDHWVAQQLREATPYGQAPKYLIRDNDRKFGQQFARVATTSGLKVLRTPYRTPRANAVCERFLGSVRRACLDHFLIFHERQLHRLLNAYVLYFNQARPHQGLGQRIPEPPVFPPSLNQSHQINAEPVLGGYLSTTWRRTIPPRNQEKRLLKCCQRW
jgi:hypothetical protein